MKIKLLASALLAASLIGAPAVAFAQSDQSKAAPETKSEATMSKTTHTHHAMRSTHMKHGTTTGMSTSSKTRPGGHPISRKPPSS